MLKSIIIKLFGIFLIWSNICVTSLPLNDNHVKTPWENLENSQQKLQPFQLYLIKKSLNPFLNECYSENCCKNMEQILCPSYYEMILQLNNTKQLKNFNENDVEKLQKVKNYMEKEMAQQFCKNISKILPQLKLNWQLNFNVKKLLQDDTFCPRVCFEEKLRIENEKILFELKPVCKMISFIGNIIANETATLNTVNINNNNNNNNYNPVIVTNNSTNNKNDINKQNVSPELKENNKQIPEISQVKSSVPNNKVQLDQEEHKDVIPTSTQTIPGKQNTKEEIKNPKDNNEDQLKNGQKDVNNVPPPLPPQPQSPNAPETENDNNQRPLQSEDNQNSGDIVNDDNKFAQIDKNQQEQQQQQQPQSQQEQQQQQDINSDPGQNNNNNNENNLGKIPIDQQGNDGNIDINPDDPDVDGLNGLNSYDDDNDPDDIKPPPPPQQADTKFQLKEQKEPTTAEIMEKVTHDMLPNAGTNYIPASDPFYEEAGSNFFTYLLAGMFICILLYVLYHNKTKVLALILEGRRSQKGRGGRRKHTAQYRKLDTNLEEAITSSTPTSGRSTQIIY